MQIGGVQINKLHFADDTVLPSECLNDLGVMVNRGVGVSENLGMKGNIEKTKVQHMGRAHKDFLFSFLSFFYFFFVFFSRQVFCVALVPVLA